MKSLAISQLNHCFKENDSNERFTLSSKNYLTDAFHLAIASRLTYKLWSVGGIYVLKYNPTEHAELTEDCGRMYF